jgi:putative oxidoreductase
MPAGRPGGRGASSRRRELRSTTIRVHCAGLPGRASAGSFREGIAMQVVFLIGRILFVAIFLVSGVRKLLDLAGTAKLIEAKLWIPTAVAPYAEKVSSMAGMSTPQLVAIVLAIIQIVFALFIIFNVGSRFAAIVLAIYVAVATFYSYDFTNFTELARGEAGTGLFKNISLFGGLLILFVIGPWQPGVVEEEEEYAHETHA